MSFSCNNENLIILLFNAKLDYDISSLASLSSEMIVLRFSGKKYSHNILQDKKSRVEFTPVHFRILSSSPKPRIICNYV